MAEADAGVKGKAGKVAEEANVSAEDLAKEFKEHSVAEFFKKNRQMLGLTGKIKTLTTVVHEYVSNSLDACESANILPDITVKLIELEEEHYELVVQDNGPGLTRETVGKALGQLLAGTKFHRLMQMRGQQGIGASGCTMLSLVTTGKPIQVISGTGKGKPFFAELTIDPKKNEPKLIKIEDVDKDFRGLTIKAVFKDIKYQKSEAGPLEYIRRTAIANPHAKLAFVDPFGEKFEFNRTMKTVPKRPVEVKPHPKGVTVDELLTMAKATQARKVVSFIKNDFDRTGEKAVEEVQNAVSFDLNTDPAKLSWEQAEEIIKAFQKINFIAPTTDGLRPIGEERVIASLKNIVEPEFLEVNTRRPQVYKGGFAFQVEVGLAYGGNAGKASEEKTEDGKIVRKVEVMRFANRVPLLFDAGGCALQKAVNSIDWKRYGIRDAETAPLTIFIHLVSVHIPYTGAGKQAVSDEEEIMEELRLALMDVGRKTYRFVANQRREAEKLQKKKIFYKYSKQVAIGLSELTGKNVEPIEKKLHDIVLKRLKLEDELEAKGEKLDEEPPEEEEGKAKKKGKKAKKGALETVNEDDE